jgi:hypothetical protein
LRHDDENNWHCRIFEPKLDEEIFIFEDIDLAIIYLDNKFYQVDDEVFADKDELENIIKKIFQKQ